jgi:sialidase-1
MTPLAALLLGVIAARAAAALPALTDVFVSGKEGYACYRIPAIVRVGSNKLLAFAEGRFYNCDDHGHNDLVQKTSEDNGATWGPLSVVYGETTPSRNVTIGNPAPVVVAGDPASPTAPFVLMAFSRNNTEAGILVSKDEGRTWAYTANLTFPRWTWVATGPPAGLQLASGRILIPSDNYVDGHYSSFAFISDDFGKTWAISSNHIVDGNECQAVALPWVSQDTLLLSMRQSIGNQRLATFSHDGGETWVTNPWKTVTATQCEGSLVALPRSKQVVMSAAFASSRTNMTLFSSRDNGLSWQPFLCVYPGPSAYSALVDMSATGATGGEQDMVGLLFERDNYTKISFAASISLPPAGEDQQ